MKLFYVTKAKSRSRTLRCTWCTYRLQTRKVTSRCVFSNRCSVTYGLFHTLLFLSHTIILFEIFIQEVLWSIRGSYWAIWSNPLTNVKWHSDPWPTVTSLPIRLSTNFMTFIPSLTFTELWVVSMEHLQRVWLASRERLPFRTPGSVPHFGTCKCSNCWDQIPRTCHVFTRLFTSNTPWYFLDFPLINNFERRINPTWRVLVVLHFLWRVY